MEKPINFFFEDTPENQEVMRKAIEEHNIMFKNTGFYLYTLVEKDNNDIQVHGK